MEIRLLLGPAGSGKTFRCLREIAAELERAPEGPPLFLVAPKQSTYQLERQLLSHPAVAGYTRLQVLSIERLSRVIFSQLGAAMPGALDEEGRLMVLRGILSQEAGRLKLFRASARLSGFARQVNLALHELRDSMATPDSLDAVSLRIQSNPALAGKLQDLAMVMRSYESWLESHGLKDSDYLLEAAADALRQAVPGRFPLAGLWVDGFGQWSAREMDLLGALISHSGRAAITFCMERTPSIKARRLTRWSSVEDAFQSFRAVCETLPGADVRVEVIHRDHDQGRYAESPALAALERHWTDPAPPQAGARADSIQLIACDDAASEARFVAREIQRHIHAGGRYREAMVLVRNLESFYEEIHGAFTQFQIPFFMDRRESICHHPIMELTRSALRLAAFDWQQEDLFAVLKSGLAGACTEDVDGLENAALERGWSRADWAENTVKDDPSLAALLARFRKEVLPVLGRLAEALRSKDCLLTGRRLAQLILSFWEDLRLEENLRNWAEAPPAGGEVSLPSAVHATVWTQAKAWLSNLEMAFPDKAMGIREWLPIVEAGFSAITVGLIPPALDQVLVGEVGRSRNPEVRATFVLGFNEGVFPARPPTPALLTDEEREELEKHHLRPGSTHRRHLAREQHLVYMACTRATRRLVLTWSKTAEGGAALSPSPMLAQIQRLLPGVPVEYFGPYSVGLENSEHASEMLAHVLKKAGADDVREVPRKLKEIPRVADALNRVARFERASKSSSISPAVASMLYGRKLRTSVSRIEEFAACPFKFFLDSGLRAGERKRFEVDAKAKGSFQHNVLAAFHEELRQTGKRWRDLEPDEVVARIARGAELIMERYRDGMFKATEKSRFVADVLTKSLQEFVGTVLEWMRSQYQFDPVAVELPFGNQMGLPALMLDLGEGAQLELSGIIDRVDVCRNPGDGGCRLVVIDYKSSKRKLENILMENGLQLQLIAYAAVLRHHPLDAGFCKPAGAFYVNLKGSLQGEPTREDANDDSEKARKKAFAHTGRFDLGALRLLDSRVEAEIGDQFNYRLKKNGELYKNSVEPLSPAEFEALLNDAEELMVGMGRRILSGETAITPFKHRKETACEKCVFQAVCRVDPWTQPWRVLRASGPVARTEDSP